MEHMRRVLQGAGQEECVAQVYRDTGRQGSQEYILRPGQIMTQGELDRGPVRDSVRGILVVMKHCSLHDKTEQHQGGAAMHHFRWTNDQGHPGL